MLWGRGCNFGEICRNLFPWKVEFSVGVGMYFTYAEFVYFTQSEKSKHYVSIFYFLIFSTRK